MIVVVVGSVLNLPKIEMKILCDKYHETFDKTRFKRALEGLEDL